jgi:uncharacterized membrane protein YidH (DUF202 family)
MPSPEPPGAAAERTRLAWERLALAFCGLAAVVLGVAAHRDAPWLVVVSAALLGVAAGVWRTGRRAYARSEVAPQPGALALLAVATALTALAAAVTAALRL